MPSSVSEESFSDASKGDLSKICVPRDTMLSAGVDDRRTAGKSQTKTVKRSESVNHIDAF